MSGTNQPSKTGSRLKRKPKKVVSNFVADSGAREEVLASPEEQEWVELFPYGVSTGHGHGRTVLILKDEAKNQVLPVWLGPTDTGVLVGDLTRVSGSPHQLTQQLLESLGVSIRECRFVDLVGHHQFVHLHLSGHPKLEHIRARADAVMSLCLYFKVRFYSTQQYMLRSRSLDVDLLSLERGLILNPEIGSKKHPYVM